MPGRSGTDRVRRGGQRGAAPHFGDSQMGQSSREGKQWRIVGLLVAKDLHAELLPVMPATQVEWTGRRLDGGSAQFGPTAAFPAATRTTARWWSICNASVVLQWNSGLRRPADPATDRDHRCDERSIVHAESRTLVTGVQLPGRIGADSLAGGTPSGVRVQVSFGASGKAARALRSNCPDALEETVAER